MNKLLRGLGEMGNKRCFLIRLLLEDGLKCDYSNRTIKAKIMEICFKLTALGKVQFLKPVSLYRIVFLLDVHLPRSLEMPASRSKIGCKSGLISISIYRIHKKTNLFYNKYKICKYVLRNIFFCGFPYV